MFRSPATIRQVASRDELVEVEVAFRQEGDRQQLRRLGVAAADVPESDQEDGERNEECDKRKNPGIRE